MQLSICAVVEGKSLDKLKEKLMQRKKKKKKKRERERERKRLAAVNSNSDLSLRNCMASRFTIYSINQISDLIYQISYIIYKISDILY